MRVNRRGVLAFGACGLAAIAGCSGLTGPSSDTGRTVSLPWTQLPGPAGGPVTDITASDANPDWLYAATRTAGILASNSGGDDWIQGFSGQHHRSRIWVSPHDPQTAFTKREWTDNGGQKWHHPDWSNKNRYAPAAAPATSLGGPTVARVYNLQWDPVDEDIIYAATPEGLYVTFDAGQSWEHRPIDDIQLPPDHRGWDFAVHPRNEGVLAVGMRTAVAVSSDYGETWSVHELSENHPEIREKFIRGVEFAGVDDPRVYVAIEGVGVFRLNNGALTDLTPNLPELVFPKHDLPLTLSADRQKLYFIAGKSAEMYQVSEWWSTRELYVYNSDTDAVSSVETPVKPNAVTTHPSNASTLYIGGDSWVHESQDGGETWTTLSGGFVDHYLATVAVNPTHPETVFAGSICSTGLSVSSNHGQSFTWKRSGLGPWHHGDFSEHYLMHIAARDDRAYATTASGLLISDDNGASWRMLKNRFSGRGEYGKRQTHLHGLGVHPEDPEIVYVGTGRGGVGGDHEDAFSGAKIWKSTDGGETWTERTEGFPTEADTTVQDITVNQQSPDTVYVGTNAVDYLGSSQDGGAGKGIYKSMNGGRSWDALSAPFENIHAVTIDATAPGTVYVSSPTPRGSRSHGAAYRSEDGGQSWERMLPYQTHALLAHPTVPDLVFAGAQKHEDYWDVLVSEDGGETWSEGALRIQASSNAGGPDLDYDAAELHSDYWGNSSGKIHWFALDEENSILYAATNGAGLWRSDVSELVG